MGGVFDKIRSLPEKTRKVILWTIVGILSTFLMWGWLNHIGNIMRNIPTEKLKEQFSSPVFDNNLPEINISLPNIEEVSTSDLEILKKELSPEELEQLKLLENNTSTENGNK